MNDVSAKISLFHNLFLVCLVLALICLVLAVVIFVLLDIRTTLGYLTGRRAKKGIKELEAATALSGRLMPKERSNMQYVAQEMKDDMGVRQKAKPGIRKVEHAVEAAVTTTEEMPVPDFTSQPEQETALLNENTGTSEEGTAVLNDDTTAMLDTEVRAMGKFVIVRDLMMIHTEEVI